MSSTKRAVSIAKDCRLLSSNFNQNSAGGGNYGHQQQYSNINLNQSNYKYDCEAAAATKFIMQPKSNKNLTDKFQNDFVGQCNNSEASKASYLWRKNDTNVFPQNNYLQQNAEEKESKSNKNILSDKNLSKSTLSLHIEAYENDAIKVQNKSLAAVGDDDGKVDRNFKKQDPFGFSRQQPKEEEEELMEAEVMAFKFSTKMMNVNGVKDKPMPHLYKQYIRIIAKWPKDKFKNEQRNLEYFLEQELEKVFHQNSTPPESGICERRLKALTELAESRHQHDFPNNYKSGIFGLKLKELNEINSDECRQQIGLGEPKKSFFVKLFGRK